ncbi:hypothetical protein [Streptomyces sp. NPDC091219]|uniref:hypothetical protein n=1 Tax=Streptomyces sp. NPDC091219 TaxID=3155193 RepID=UPI00344CF57F
MSSARTLGDHDRGTTARTAADELGTGRIQENRSGTDEATFQQPGSDRPNLVFHEAVGDVPDFVVPDLAVQVAGGQGAVGDPIGKLPGLDGY